MRAILIVFITIAIVGCAVTAKPIIGPDGRTAYVLKCSGYGRDRESCLEKAGQTCPAGYFVVDDNRSDTGAVITQYAVIAAHRDYMTISCK